MGGQGRVSEGLREAGIAFREPVPAREALAAIPDEFWEALNKVQFGLSYDADALEAGLEDCLVGVFRAVGIYGRPRPRLVAENGRRVDAA